jgi:hypothetical protein
MNSHAVAESSVALHLWRARLNFLRDKIDTLPIRTAALFLQAAKVDDTATERFVEEAGADTATVAVCTTFLRSLTQPVVEVETADDPEPEMAIEVAQEAEEAQAIAVDASDEAVDSKLPATDASTVSRFKEYASKPAMGW